MEKISAILLLGPTSAGKTPLGEVMAQKGLWGRRCHHFDFGCHLRRIVAAAEPPEDFTQDDVDLLAAVLRSGALLEDEHFAIAEKILLAFIADRRIDGDSWIVLNGLPRHVGQAKNISTIIDVQVVIHLSCPQEAVLERIRTNVGGDRKGRTDDQRDATRAKLEIFSQRIAPLLDHYRCREARIETINVNANTTPENIWLELNGRA